MLTRKPFYVVDYDGNNDMPYDKPRYNKATFMKIIYVGIIKSVTKDTFKKIDWDNTAVINGVNWETKINGS
jgi:hypothetical protein